MSDKESPFRTSRRSMLSAVAGTSVVAAFGTATSKRATSSVTAIDSIDDVLLGTFESTFDGWRAGGDLALSRVARHDRPVAVTEGEYALEAAVDGESTPTLWRSITGLDLSTYPYFVADVVPGRIDGTDAPVAFRFRLARPTDLLDGSSTLETVAESDPVTIPQATPGQLYWDASDVDIGLLETVSRLEIVWHPADHDPDSSKEGEDGAYRGDVVFDAIRATDSIGPVGRARLATTMRELQFDHGAYVRTEVTEEFEAGEAGTFVFADGTTEPYRFETLAADRLRLTIADTEIDFGAGWS
ncbi:hypothetical protein OB955_08605 [Halobacteria archaeon AArc-m2/3/4]|uniref:Tat (Twin-arginine translocation) pathway signal sequence n=1 Tax=Natronoglomus mannanivorans TaxID=2979990 RepID=A0ABT2QD14_9EURY|nr:hypothetical protein [Halobacteria archaeon AArc-m2/3/4]